MTTYIVSNSHGKHVAAFSSKRLAKEYIANRAVKYFNKIINPRETMPFGCITKDDLHWDGSEFIFKAPSGKYYSYGEYYSNLSITGQVPLNPPITNPTKSPS